ncbi:hypothetical protein BGY98DRAFT_931926 [Russula aff. rugulosa BPL654]|nr:hypothetical protein BGY98DRAFT_938208 [Russula aff. rugulosa BPL654]KAI0281567.1 hypothetical protein BGY98DRAFT_931926 [Russula aff. rugulosa BPL654]
MAPEEDRNNVGHELGGPLRCTDDELIEDGEGTGLDLPLAGSLDLMEKRRGTISYRLVDRLELVDGGSWRVVGKGRSVGSSLVCENLLRGYQRKPIHQCSRLEGQRKHAFVEIIAREFCLAAWAAWRGWGMATV